jgi:hypothetical protein
VTAKKAPIKPLKAHALLIMVISPQMSQKDVEQQSVALTDDQTGLLGARNG